MDDVRRLDGGRGDTAVFSLDELAREGARRMIAAALEAEVEEYVASFSDELDEDGRRLVVRNGHARERGLTVGSGTVRLRAPRVNDKRVDEGGEWCVQARARPDLRLLRLASMRAWMPSRMSSSVACISWV